LRDLMILTKNTFIAILHHHNNHSSFNPNNVSVPPLGINSQQNNHNAC